MRAAHRRAAPAAGRRRELDALLRDGRRGDAQPRLTPPDGAPRGAVGARIGRTGGGGRRRRRRRASRRAEADRIGGSPRRRRPTRRTPGSAARPSTARPPTPGHRVLAPDDAEVEAYLETALKAPAPDRSTDDRPGRTAAAARHRRRPRLRQPVRPADRAPGPRARRLFGAAPARHPVRGARAPRDPGDHPVRRSDVGLRRRRAPSPTRRSGRGQIPVLGICYGAQLMARELGGDVAPDRRSREYGPANVTITTTTACSPASSASSRSG